MNETPLAHLDRDDPVPPFEQVRSQIAARVASGDLAPGTRLPSVRALAEQLGLATNTVARVYKELEADGVVVTAGRRGTVVAGGDSRDGVAAEAAAKTYADRARLLGLTQQEALRLLEDAWRR